MRLEYQISLGISALAIFLLGYFFAKPFLDLILLISILIVAVPIALDIAIRNQIRKELEESFLRFALDLAEVLKAGLPISLALAEVSKNDYGLLTDSVRRLAARIDWGIGVEESFMLFARETESELIERNVKMLIELYRAGGDLGKSLEALINSLIEIRRLRRERESAVYENILHAYFVFLFFLGIALVLRSFLLPFLNTSLLPDESSNVSTSNIGEMIFHLALIQAIFAGLILGKMSEGTVKAGIKHSLIFVLLSIIILKIIAGIVIPRTDIVQSLMQGLV